MGLSIQVRGVRSGPCAVAHFGEPGEVCSKPKVQTQPGTSTAPSRVSLALEVGGMENRMQPLKKEGRKQGSAVCWLKKKKAGFRKTPTGWRQRLTPLLWRESFQSGLRL